MPEDSQGAQRRRALLVGIGRYPYFPPENQLDGCVHDVDLMARVLEDRFGFAPDDIVKLCDSAATRAGILAAMEALADDVEPGEVVVLHWSGHGSQKRSDDPGEPDGLDETLVPYDSGRGRHENRDITDKEIYDWVLRLSRRTPWVTLVFDACHSGGAARTLGQRRVQADLRPPAVTKLRGNGVDARKDRCPPAPGASGWLPVGSRYVLMAGSRDHEPACELPAAEAGGVTHGALTYHLCRGLLAAPAGATYRDVFEAVAFTVNLRFPLQHPQLEGARDRRLFDTGGRPSDAYVLVSHRLDGTLAVLQGGAAHGLTPGSEWTVLPSGLDQASGESQPVGRVMVVETGAVDARANVLEESTPGAVTTGCRAVEAKPAPGAGRLTVALAGSSDHNFGSDCSFESRARLAGRLDSSPWLREVDAGRGPRVTVEMSGGPEGPSLLALGPSGEAVALPRAVVDPLHVERLVADLERYARFRQVLELENTAAGSSLRGRAEMQVFRRPPRGQWHEARSHSETGGLELHEGDGLAFRIEHHHPRSLYVCLLDLGLTGRVEILYPPPGAVEALVPGRGLEIGLRSGEELEVFVPEDYPFVEGRGTSADPSYFKLLVSTQPTDFSPLLRSGAGNGTRGATLGVLGARLADILEGPHSRDVRRIARGPDWDTVTRRVRVHRTEAAIGP
ncbi:MAG: caspase family protein [Acidobacteriota bacterium]